MGFFSNLDTEKYDRQYEDSELLRRMWDYFKPHYRRIVWSVLLLTLIGATSASVPLLVSNVINNLGQELTDSALYWLGGLVLFVGVLAWGLNWIRRRLTAIIIGDVVVTVRTDAFAAAASQDLTFYDQFSSGRVVSRITSDTTEFGNMVNLSTDLVSQMLQAAILLVALAFIETRLLLYVFGYLPVVYFIAVGFRNLARWATRRGFRAMGNVNAAIKETVSGIAVAKNYRQEKTIFDEFDEANQSSFKVNLQRGMILSAVFPVLNGVAGIGTAMILYVGGVNVADLVITVGAWFLFLQSLDRFWFPVLNLSSFWTQLQSGLSAAERSFALIDAEHSVVQREEKLVARLKGQIDFEHVDFFYTEGEPVLQQFDLHIKSGENIALVGHTGAGKSSIAKLVSRFYEFQSGRILVDGQDIREINLHDYRRQLGIVSQIPFLFSESVLQNIQYANPDATEDQILALANRIGDGEWLETFPQGLHTEVGERGGRLSMGQRQLISLLRVLVQDPAIFILDEATASIDPFTEWQIQQALDLILKNTTSILIAHRLSTVKAADRIIVLRQGSIIEEGSHDSLLAAGGHYAELYNTYFRHQSLAYVEAARDLAKKPQPGD